MRDTKAVKIQAVDAVDAQLVFIVQEYLFHATFFLSECRSSGHKSTVANFALPDVLRNDALGTKEGLSGESVLRSRPCAIRCCPAIESLTGIRPNYGFPVVREGAVSEQSGPTVNAVEVRYSDFIPGGCALANRVAEFGSLSLRENLMNGRP